MVEIFSTFLWFKDDRATDWMADPRLKRSMATLVKQTNSKPATVWARYWHSVWQQASTTRLAEEHLYAYLQEACYWVVHKIAFNFVDRALFADLFQLAIARVPRLLKRFNPEYSELKHYAERGFKNALKDWLREQQQIEMCTNWSLLYRLSRKGLVAALQWQALSALTIEQYVLAWECFCELYAVDAGRIKALKNPEATTLQAIATAYNAERLGRLSAPTAAVDAAILEQWLLACAETVRRFRQPTVLSGDAPRPGQESGSLLQTIADDAQPPLEALLHEEDERQRQERLAQLHSVLEAALAALEAQPRALLEIYYGQDLTQTQIAQQLGIKQYQVSRQLERLRRSLLQTLAQWSQETLHISLTPEVVDAMSLLVEAWLMQRMQAEGNETS